VKDESSGIGLKNVLRRLDLLYPNQHRLDIRDTPEDFEVNLEMTLQRF
jgi:LytS/YehU family sensor histidine kinase